jgi:peptidyl-prolyl cis-trans isomerase SurA
MNLRRTVALLALALALVLVAPGRGSAEPEPIDRIVAVVGSEIILLSELDEEVYLAHLRGELNLEDEAGVEKYRSEVLDALVEGKLLIEEARRQGLRATREEIDRAVENMIQDVRSRFPTEEAFTEQLQREGTSADGLRRTYRDKVEEQLVVRQLVDKTVRSKVLVADGDVKAYWDSHQGEIPDVPARLQLRRILVGLSADSQVDSAAVERARLVRERLDNGEDFATLAKVFSEGPAAQKGGELGWFALEDLDPRLREAVAPLGEGELSQVVLTGRGAHLLRVDAIRDDGDRSLRQIVFLRDEKAARAQARAKAERLRAQLVDGADFAELARTESDDAATAPRGGELGEIPLEALDATYRGALERLEPGSLSEVVEDDQGFSIFRVDGREGERAPTFDEMRPRIATLLEQEKGQVLYDELLKEARDRTYVEIRLAETEG